MRTDCSRRARMHRNPTDKRNAAIRYHLRQQTRPQPLPQHCIPTPTPPPWTRKPFSHLKYTLGGVLFSRSPTVSSSRSRIFRCWFTPSLAPSSTIKIRSEDLATAITYDAQSRGTAEAGRRQRAEAAVGHASSTSKPPIWWRRATEAQREGVLSLRLRRILGKLKCTDTNHRLNYKASVESGYCHPSTSRYLFGNHPLISIGGVYLHASGREAFDVSKHPTRAPRQTLNTLASKPPSALVLFLLRM